MKPARKPPVANGIHGKVRRVSRGAHADVPLVTFRIIDAVLRGPALRVLRKVVSIHLLRLLPPRSPGVLEVSDQFLLLGVHTDSRVTRAPELFTLGRHVPELTISLRMGFARVQHFPMAPQTVVLLS